MSKPPVEETVQPIASIDPETEESTITNNWQNYQNSEFGFKVNYPQDWEYQELDKGILFGTPESKSGGILGNICSPTK